MLRLHTLCANLTPSFGYFLSLLTLIIPLSLHSNHFRYYSDLYEG